MIRNEKDRKTAALCIMMILSCVAVWRWETEMNNPLLHYTEERTDTHTHTHTKVTENGASPRDLCWLDHAADVKDGTTVLPSELQNERGKRSVIEMLQFEKIRLSKGC